MYISRVEIKNFRNFKKVEVDLQKYAVIVGANKAGKSNFIEAIKLGISPYINRNEETLNDTDFWLDEHDPTSTPEQIIEISVEITLDEKEMPRFVAAISKPNIARFEYIFRLKKPSSLLIDESEEASNSDKEELEHDDSLPQYETSWKMGANNQDVIKTWGISGLKKRFSFEVLEALRDTEGIVARWQRSPLKSLLKSATKNYDIDILIKTIIEKASELKSSENSHLGDLVKSLNFRGEKMVGSVFNINADLDLNLFPSGAEDLLRQIQLYVDGKRPTIRTSLGTQNILYLSLLLEEMQNRQQAGEENGEYQQLLLSLEEPEAHIHPHLQRSVFSYFIKNIDFVKSLIVTTHSVHIASVSPISSIVIIRNEGKEGSKADYLREKLPSDEIEDIERYLDVTRAELVFARGVIFVEGIAEEYLIPTFAKSLKKVNLDHYGISVIPIQSTNFAPFVKLVSPRNLNIPFTILTDGDPHAKYDSMKGINRAKSLASLILDNDEDTTTWGYEELKKIGIFVGDYTLEVDLIQKHVNELVNVYSSFVPHNLRNRDNVIENFRTQIQDMEANFGSLDKATIKDYIDEIEARSSKGRFAQRLASVIEKSDQVLCPSYIEDCLTYIIDKIELLSARTEPVKQPII